MNLRDLRYLVAVADHRHFGKAAEASFVSQPTLSMQIRKLEDELGVTVFERQPRQVLVTPAGEDIVARARHILAETDAMIQSARASQDPYAGDLRLGAFPTLAPYLLPSAVPKLHRKWPKLRLLLTEEKTDELIARLLDGRLDAALLALPVSHEGLEAIELFDDPFLLAVPSHHPFATKKDVTTADLHDEPLLLLEEGHCLRDQALEACSLSGGREQQDFRATSLETLRQMVATGVGITLMPKLAIRHTDDGIAYLPFRSDPPSRRIGMVFRRTTPRRQLLEAAAPCCVPDS